MEFKVKDTILLLFAGLLLLQGPVLAQETMVISAVDGSTSSLLCIPVVREAYKRIGYEIDITRFPGKAALEKSNAGEVDAELQRIDGISSKYPNLIQIHIPVNYLQGSAFATNAAFPVNGWYSLKPYRIGIVKGILFAQQGTEGMDVKAADSYQDLFLLLDRAEVDVIVVTRIKGLVAIRDQKVKGMKELEGLLEQMFLYHYVHKKNKALVPGLEKAFKQMLIDGTIRRLRDEALKNLLAGE